MTVLAELQSASFKGVPFLLKSSSGTGGRKKVTHEFVDSDIRFVQDLGLLNKTFTVTGITQGEGYDYFSNRDNLIRVLESDGDGQLVHPFYGVLTVASMPYTISEENASLGVAIFEMTFSLTQANQTPYAITNNLSAILDVATQVVSLVNNDIALSYSIKNGFPNNYSDGLNKILDIGNYFETNTAQFNTSTTQTAQMNTQINNFLGTAPALNSNPSDLGASINDLFTQSNNLTEDPSEAVSYFQLFFDFGDDDIQIDTDTIQKQERQTNRNLLNGSVLFSSLALAYQNASLIAYETETELNNMRNLLEAQFQKVSQNPSVSQETQAVLQSLRAEMRKFFLQQETITSKIITIQQNTQIPVTVLAYQYYGSTDNAQKIIDLNRFNDISFVSGNINILTENAI